VPSKKTKRREQPPFWRWFLGEVFELVRQFGNPIIWASVTCFLIYAVMRTLEAFAGRVSVADLALKIVGHLDVAIAASVTLSGLTSTLWINECRRHRNTRKRLTERSEKLERLLDPNRESSRLTREGTTRKGDE
jgi:hypothetical protein